jgi:hypothetical protein
MFSSEKLGRMQKFSLRLPDKTLNKGFRSEITHRIVARPQADVGPEDKGLDLLDDHPLHGGVLLQEACQQVPRLGGDLALRVAQLETKDENE